MDEVQLYHELQRHLRLTTRVISKIGDMLVPDDELRVRFSVMNTAPIRKGPRDPKIHFCNTRLIVEQTRWARPVSAPCVWIDLPETYLRPGESTHVDLDLVALDTLSGLFDFIGGLEDVISAWVSADLDQDVFFRMWSGVGDSQVDDPSRFLAAIG
jgi:hypothetical protein